MSKYPNWSNTEIEILDLEFSILNNSLLKAKNIPYFKGYTETFCISELAKIMSLIK